jgi:hypothetical protein
MTDERDKPLTGIQLQLLAEYVAAQVMAGVLEHEARVHNPNDNRAALARDTANKARLAMLDVLRAHLVRT